MQSSQMGHIWTIHPTAYMLYCRLYSRIYILVPRIEVWRSENIINVCHEISASVAPSYSAGMKIQMYAFYDKNRAS